MTRALLLILTFTMTLTACVASKPKNHDEYLQIFLAEQSPIEGITEMKSADFTSEIYLHKNAIITNNDIKSASVQLLENEPAPGVAIHFTTQGSKKIKKAITNHLQKRMPIVVDHKIITAPIVQSTNIGDTILITGLDSFGEARRLADRINGK